MRSAMIRVNTSIGPPARRRHHHANRPVRIILRQCCVRQRQQRRHYDPTPHIIPHFSTILCRRVEARQKPVQRVAMRPSLLDPLFAALTTLPGVGPKLEKLYRKLFGREDTPARVIDLLFHLPAGTIDRRSRPVLRDVVPGSVATVAVTVESHRPPPPNRPRLPYRIETYDDSGTLTLTYFHAKRDYLEKLFPVGELRYVSGTTALYDGMLQMVHPDRVVSEAELDKLPMVEPVYPLTEGLTLNPVRKAAEAALTKIRSCRSGRTRPGSNARAFPPSPRPCRACITRPSPPTSCRRAKPGRGSPMTSCWPASSRSRSCARTSASCPAAAAPAKASCAPRWLRPCPIR